MFFDFVDTNSGFCERWGNTGCFAVRKYWYGYNIIFTEREFSKTYQKESLNAETKAQKLASFLLFLPSLVILPLGIILKGASFLSREVRRKYTVNVSTYDSFVRGRENQVAICKIESIYAVIISLDSDYGCSILYAYIENSRDISGDLVYETRNDFRGGNVFQYQVTLNREKLLVLNASNGIQRNDTPVGSGEDWNNINELEGLINRGTLSNVSENAVNTLLKRDEVTEFINRKRAEFIAQTHR